VNGVVEVKNVEELQVKPGRLPSYPVEDNIDLYTSREILVLNPCLFVSSQIN